MRQAIHFLATALAVMNPAVAFWGADVLAPAGRLLRSVPDARELMRLFPHLDAREARRLVARMMRIEARNHVLASWLRRGGRARVRRLLAPDAPPVLPKPPLILGTFHVGPVHALGAALEGTSPLLALRNEGYADDQRRAAAFYHATARLRRGELVLMALDPQRASRIDAPFLGGTLQLARGAFALSLATGAPIVPIVARWRGLRIEAVTGDALIGDDEPSLAASAAQWLERYLVDAPDETSLRILDLMKR